MVHHLAHPIFCQCKAAPHGECIAAFRKVFGSELQEIAMWSTVLLFGCLQYVLVCSNTYTLLYFEMNGNSTLMYYNTNVYVVCMVLFRFPMYGHLEAFQGHRFRGEYRTLVMFECVV